MSARFQHSPAGTTQSESERVSCYFPMRQQSYNLTRGCTKQCLLGLGPANAIRAQPVLAPTPTPGTSTLRSNVPNNTSACSPATLRRINVPYSRTATTLVFIPVHPVLCRITILSLSRSPLHSYSKSVYQCYL
jgi:hypothetical protein